MVLNFKEFINENNSTDEEKTLQMEDIIQRVKKFLYSKSTMSSEDYFISRMRSLMFHNNIDNLNTKKAEKIFHDKPFVRKEKDGSYGGFFIHYKGGYNKFSHFSQIYYELSTPYGKIYIEERKEKDEVYIYTSHFFDRYYDRTFNGGVKSIPTIKKRDISIKDYLKNMCFQISKGAIGASFNNETGNFITNHTNGSGLGKKIDRFYIFKTYISKDMYNKNELQKTKELDEYIRDDI